MSSFPSSFPSSTPAPQPEQGNKKPESSKNQSLLFIWDVVKIVIISLAIVIPIRYFVIQTFIVKGSSMEPNFSNSQFLIVNELTYRAHAPERGDIIVFKYPYNQSEYFIKRVIGLPGEKVEIADGNVYIYNNDNPNGVQINEPYLKQDTKTFGDMLVTLGNEEYFVLGDNRGASSDSRSWGVLQKRFIVGKVWLRAWPLDAVSTFKNPGYNLTSSLPLAYF